jgi:hypothetical protein
MLGAGSGALDGAADRLADGFDIRDIFFDDRVGRKWLYRVALDPVTGTAFAQFQQLDGCGADIQADERRCSPFK